MIRRHGKHHHWKPARPTQRLRLTSMMDILTVLLLFLLMGVRLRTRLSTMPEREIATSRALPAPRCRVQRVAPPGDFAHY